MRKLAPIFLIFALVCTGATQDIPNDKAADINKLIDISGAKHLGELISADVVKKMTEGLAQVYATAPDSLPAILTQEVDKLIDEGMGEDGALKALLIELYDKQFTHDEVKGLIEFYSTPLGQKTVEIMPSLTKDCVEIGGQWAGAMGYELVSRITARVGQPATPTAGK